MAPKNTTDHIIYTCHSLSQTKVFSTDA